ncbi:MAG: hypothetical protein ACTTJC_04310 [Campylobacter sp.]
MARNFLLLTILISLSFSSDDYVIWAKIFTQNNQVVQEKILISQAVALKGLKYDFLCELQHKKDENQTTLQYLEIYKNSVFDCFESANFKVEDYTTKDKENININTTITMTPIRFTIEFKQNSAIIKAFLNKKD